MRKFLSVIEAFSALLIILTLNSNAQATNTFVRLNNVTVLYSSGFYIDSNGFSLVSIRYVRDLLGMSIDCIRDSNYVCNVSFGNKQKSVKGVITYVNKVSSSAEEDRVFIRLRYLADLFGIKIFFDSSDKTIYIDDIRLFTNYNTGLKNFYFRDVLKEQAFINEDSTYKREIIINSFASYSKIPCKQNVKECLIFRLGLKNNQNIEIIPETITIGSFDVKGGYIFFGNLYPAPPDHANLDYYESLRAKPCGTQKTKLLLCNGQIPINDKVEFIILFASNQ